MKDSFLLCIILLCSIKSGLSFLSSNDGAVHHRRGGGGASFALSRPRRRTRMTPAGASLQTTTATTTTETTTTPRHVRREASPVQVVDQMPPRLPPRRELKNHYYLLRHGQSTANVAEVISSARSLAYTPKHGLTDLGYQQGQQSATQLLNILERNSVGRGNGERERLVFISSPFARAYQTAQACLDGLLQDEEHTVPLQSLNIEVCPDIQVHDHLVERYFGKLDGQALYTYAYVWPLDQFNVTHTAFNVESVAAVCTRLRQVVNDLEARYTNCHLVWVSHADVLQIAQLYASGMDNVGLFSSYRFQNGEVRPMEVGCTTGLPQPVPLEAPRRGTLVTASAR